MGSLPGLMPASLDTIANLAKQRGFVFQSSEIYGGIRSAYDYGPLGVELLRNVKNEWWRAMVQERDDVVGLDSAILQARQVWKASGHEAVFTDPLVECRTCNQRFRLDKLPDASHLPELRGQGQLHRTKGIQPDVPDPHGPGRGRRQPGLPATGNRPGNIHQL